MRTTFETLAAFPLAGATLSEAGIDERPIRRLRELIATHIAEGRDHDAIIATFIKDFGGQDVLAAPVDEGFNRLAWLFPYLAGLTALVAVALTTRRWARHSTPAHAVAADAGSDRDLDDRLDDELRNLD